MTRPDWVVRSSQSCRDDLSGLGCDYGSIGLVVYAFAAGGWFATTSCYEAGNDALRRWLRRRGSQPAHLLAMAGDFPKAYAAIRRSLEVLL